MSASTLLLVLGFMFGLPLLVLALVSRMKRPPSEFTVLVRKMRADFVRVQITLVDQLTPALKRAAEATRGLVAAFGGLDEDTRAEIMRLREADATRTARSPE